MTLALAIIGILTGLASFAWSVYQGRTNGKRLDREEDRRQEEVALLRRQVEHITEQGRENQHAVLVGRSQGFSGSSAGVSFPISVRNVGPATARDVAVWLVLDDGQPVATVHEISNRHDLDTLMSGDPPVTASLLQPAPFAGGKVPRPGLIVASWTDDAGEHVESIGKLDVFL